MIGCEDRPMRQVHKALQSALLFAVHSFWLWRWSIA